MTYLSDDLRELVFRKRQLAILSRRKKELELRVLRLEHSCYDRMEKEGFAGDDDSIKVDGVLHLPRRTTYADVQDKKLLIEYLLEHDEGLIDQALRKKELNKLVRTRLDNHQELPPGLGYHDKTYISTRGINATQEDSNADEG
jgi:hypothetical protein